MQLCFEIMCSVRGPSRNKKLDDYTKQLKYYWTCLNNELNVKINRWGSEDQA